MRMLGTQRFSTCFHMFPHAKVLILDIAVSQKRSGLVTLRRLPWKNPRLGSGWSCCLAPWPPDPDRGGCVCQKIFPDHHSPIVSREKFLDTHFTWKKHFWNEARGNDVPHITSRPKTQQKNSILPQSCPPARPLNPPVQHHCPHYFDAITWVKI